MCEAGHGMAGRCPMNTSPLSLASGGYAAKCVSACLYRHGAGIYYILLYRALAAGSLKCARLGTVWGDVDTQQNACRHANNRKIPDVCTDMVQEYIISFCTVLLPMNLEGEAECGMGGRCHEHLSDHFS